MGKFVLVMKKWWLIALVFTLALSLTSCQKRRPEEDLQGEGFAFGYCDDPSYGSFDVYVIRSVQDSTLYEFIVIPVEVEPGEIAQIHIANASPSYKQMVREVVLYPNEEIFAGYLSEADLQTFDRIAITPFDGSGATFLEQAPEKAAVCELPLPGYGTPDGTGTTYGVITLGSGAKPRTSR